jgi:hypothetical protein
VSGFIRRVTTRSGKNDNGAWSFTTVRILGDECMTDIRWPDDWWTPTEGTEVKLICEVEVFRGNASIRPVTDLGTPDSRRPERSAGGSAIAAPNTPPTASQQSPQQAAPAKVGA